MFYIVLEVPTAKKLPVCLITHTLLIFSIITTDRLFFPTAKLHFFLKIFCQFAKCVYFCTRFSNEKRDLLAQLV